MLHPLLHIIEAPEGAFPLPMTLGHENAGWVEAELAGKIGAHHTVKSDADAATFIRELVGSAPGGAEAVFDFVGVAPTVTLAASVRRP